jgi:biotin transport system substrate-specific component
LSRVDFIGEADMLTNVTYAGVFRPSMKIYAGLYDIVLIIGGSLLIAASTQLKIFLPFSPVPITGQTFAVLMVAALFGAWRGSLSVLLYIMMGMTGVGIFALGGGFSILLGPTGGYLVGFVVAAYITGLLAERGWDRRIETTILAMAFGNIILYFFGLLWLCCLMGFSKNVLMVGLYPFIIGDLLKIALAAFLLPSGWKLLN